MSVEVRIKEEIHYKLRHQHTLDQIVWGGGCIKVYYFGNLTPGIHLNTHIFFQLISKIRPVFVIGQKSSTKNHLIVILRRNGKTI